MSVQLLRRKFTVQQYHQMLESGILREDDRVELIRGEIIEMSPIGTKHAACVKCLNKLLYSKLGDRVLIAIQDPIILTNKSEPQPDVALLKPVMIFMKLHTPNPRIFFY